MTSNTLKLTLNVNFTSNNIIVNIVQNPNKIIASYTSGRLKFKGSTKKCLIAAETIAIIVAGKIINQKTSWESLIISMRGFSDFKMGFLKKLSSFPLPFKEISIHQDFAVPHNGCKFSKKRRK